MSKMNAARATAARAKILETSSRALRHMPARQATAPAPPGAADLGAELGCSPEEAAARATRFMLTYLRGSKLT